MCPFRVSIGQMWGTNRSSRTLFKATHTAAISESHNSRPGGCRVYSRFQWSLCLLAVVLFLNSYVCDAKRVSGGRHNNLNVNGIYPGAPAPNPPIQRPQGNQAVIHGNSDSNVNHDLDEFYIDEKEEDIKTVRFENHKKKPDDNSSGKRKGNHRTHHRHSSKPIPNANDDDDDDDDDMRNEIRNQRNHISQRKKGNRDSSNNADSATLEEFPIPPPLETLKKGDGLDSRELKHFIEDVAESILAEADRLYGVIESGSGVGFGDTTSALQVSSSFDVGNYIICQ